MSDDNKILKEKRKQSSITTAAMSICVSSDTLEELYELISSYDTFKAEKSQENFNKLEVRLLRLLFDANRMKNNEILRLKEQLVSKKIGTIDEVINQFFKNEERLDS